MIRDQIEIAIGDRFKMSTLGAARCPRLAAKGGVIVGGGQAASRQRRCTETILSLSNLARHSTA